MAVVVMRVTTLKASAGRLGGLLAYYAGLAEDRGHDGPGRGPVDYYLDPDEAAGDPLRKKRVDAGEAIHHRGRLTYLNRVEADFAAALR